VTYDKVVPLNPSTVVEYKKIRLPEVSRTVDFSQNVSGKPAYDSSLISYGRSEAGNLHELSIAWDQNIGSWTTHKIYGQYPEKHGVSGWHHHFRKSMTGDFYFLADDIGTYTPKFMMFDKGTEELGEVSASTQYNIGINSPGLFRHFLDISNQEKNNSNVRFDIMNIDDGARMQFIHSGLTLPINAALWAGADGSTLHSHHWQGDGSGNLIYDKDGNGTWILRDATAAVKLVTKDACAKLKRDWGDNLRIYLIKYRKQDKYKHPVTKAATNFDYSYLDNCATGTDEPYMYDVATQSELTSALSAISEDIKEWAGYEEAKNVS
jgi:hypothetical protein